MKKKILIFLIVFGVTLLSLFVFVFFYAGLYEFIAATKQLPINIQIEDHTTEVDGITIHYRTLGQTEQQPLIFIHGWGGTYNNNDAVTTALYEQGFQVYTMEVPGLDRSSTPNTHWANDDYARYFAKVVEKLGIEKPIIVGQSFGGGIAASYALLFPDKIKYLILIDSNTTDKDFLYPKLVRLLGNIFTSSLQSRIIPNAIKDTFISLMLSVPNDQISQSSYSERSAMGQTFILTHTENQFEKLKSISVPTILIWGESDKKVTLEQAKKMQKRLQKSTLSTLPGGHTVIYKDPEAVANLIRAEIDNFDNQY
jgi:pimeloyl-ACP methyl ester carboxylesterase